MPSPSASPSSFARYAGARGERGVTDASLLRERGDEKVRIGRGRGGEFKTEVELELEEEDITEALRLRSASEGDAVGSGDGCDTWMCSIVCSSSGAAC